MEALLERELTQREERSHQQRLGRAHFPYAKRLEDFDFSVLPSLQKTRCSTWPRATSCNEHQNLLMVGASGLGKTHLLIGVGRALCQRGYRVLFRTAAALATELEAAQRELRLPAALTSSGALTWCWWTSWATCPFPDGGRTALPVLCRPLRAGECGTDPNLDFAHWTEVFGQEQMTAALLDRLVHRSVILALSGESYRFRQSLQRQQEGAGAG